MTIENLIELFAGKRVKLKPNTTKKAFKIKKGYVEATVLKGNIEYLKL